MPLEQGADRSAELAEKTDNSAELQFASQKDVVDYRDKLVANFDKGFAGLSGDQAFRTEFKAALDQIIKKETERFINVKDLKELAPGAVTTIAKVVEGKMQLFKNLLEGQVGYIRDVSDVTDTKKFLAEDFKQTPSKAPADLAHETHNDAQFKFTTKLTLNNKGEAQDLKSLTIDYQEKTGKTATMTLEKNKDFYASTAKSVPGSLADKIRQNGDLYQLPGVNYEIRDPKGFNSFVSLKLKEAGKDPSKISAEEAIQLAADFTKAQLKIADKNTPIENMSSDKIPIDQLIMEKGEGVCRHFTAATKVIFEEIQKIAAEKGNQNLADIVPFENHMPFLQHGSLAYARGPEVTTTDSFWYAGTEPNKTPTLEATFDGQHGYSSLYLTLSKTPVGKPDARIFDMGSSEQLIRQSQKDLGVWNNLADNPNQGFLLRAYEVTTNESLQSPNQILVTSKTLMILTNAIMKNPTSTVNKAAISGLTELSKSLVEIVEKKLSSSDPKGKEELIPAKYILETFISAPLHTLDSPPVEDPANPRIIIQLETKILATDLDENIKEELKLVTAQQLLTTAHAKCVSALNNSIAQSQSNYDFEQLSKGPSLAAITTFTNFVKKYNLEGSTELSPLISGLEKNISTALPRLTNPLAIDFVSTILKMLNF
jgi:hypothetical protein